MTEFLQYNMLKESVRAKLTRKSSRPDVEKIKKDLRTEVEADYRKNSCYHRRFEVTFKNRRLYLHIIKT